MRHFVRIILPKETKNILCKCDRKGEPFSSFSHLLSLKQLSSPNKNFVLKVLTTFKICCIFIEKQSIFY